jgi:hypothetical protein
MPTSLSYSYTFSLCLFSMHRPCLSFLSAPCIPFKPSPPMPSRPPLCASLPCLLRGHLLLCMLCKLSVHASSPCLPFLLAPCLLPMPNPNIPSRPILNASPHACTSCLPHAYLSSLHLTMPSMPTLHASLPISALLACPCVPLCLIPCP